MTTEELIAARRAEPWREALRKSKKNKERTDIPRVEMNELDAEYRSHTRLEEVNLGLTKEQAMQEGWSTAPDNVRSLGFGAGMGLPNIKKYTDYMDIKTEIGAGTRMTLVVRSASS